MPVAMISAIYALAMTTGANRVIRGARIEHVCGDPELGPEKDFDYGVRIVETAEIIATGGLIPKGNPDHQTSGDADEYFTYSIEGFPTLTSEHWEAFHGGYYNQISSDNPHYVMPLRQLRHLEAQGKIGGIYSRIFTLPGVSTPVAKSQRLGREIAGALQEAGVDACILVAT